MFLQNPARTAATVDPNLNIASRRTLQLKLAFAAGGPIATSASIVGTTAYVGAWDGYEYAVNTTTGTPDLEAVPGHPPIAAVTRRRSASPRPPTMVNGVVYVGGGGAYWYALDAATGTVLWKVFTGDQPGGGDYNWSSPLIVRRHAYIGIASNCDDPLVQGELMKVAISGAQQGQVVASYAFVPNGEVGGGVWTSPPTIRRRTRSSCPPARSTTTPRPSPRRSSR